MKYQYNDNELLYLMCENDDALGILFKKYVNLIHKRLRRFQIKPRNYDDFLQEGMMALNDAIKTFNPDFNKSFNKYFDLILQRRIIALIKKERNYFYNVHVVEDISIILKENNCVYRPLDFEYELTEFEKYIYKLRYEIKYRPTEMAKILGCDVKKVYNILYTLKQKIRKQMQE